MIHVIATVELKPGTQKAYLTEFKKVIADVRAEAGCIEYGPTIDASTDIPTQFKIGPDRVTVVEKWDNVEALKAHAVAPHMQAMRARVKDYIVGMELRVLTPA